MDLPILWFLELFSEPFPDFNTSTATVSHIRNLIVSTHLKSLAGLSFQLMFCKRLSALKPVPDVLV